MTNKMRSLALILILPLLLGAKRKDSGLISFHLESGQENQKEESVQIRVSQKSSIFLRSLVFNQRDIDIFIPFCQKTERAMEYPSSLRKRKLKNSVLFPR